MEKRNAGTEYEETSKAHLSHAKGPQNLRVVVNQAPEKTVAEKLIDVIVPIKAYQTKRLPKTLGYARPLRVHSASNSVQGCSRPLRRARQHWGPEHERAPTRHRNPG